MVSGIPFSSPNSDNWSFLFTLRLGNGEFWMELTCLVGVCGSSETGVFWWWESVRVLFGVGDGEKAGNGTGEKSPLEERIFEGDQSEGGGVKSYLFFILFFYYYINKGIWVRFETYSSCWSWSCDILEFFWKWTRTKNNYCYDYDQIKIEINNNKL